MCAVVYVVVHCGACTSSELDIAETGISIVDLVLFLNFNMKIDFIIGLVSSICVLSFTISFFSLLLTIRDGLLKRQTKN